MTFSKPIIGDSNANDVTKATPYDITRCPRNSYICNIKNTLIDNDNAITQFNGQYGKGSVCLYILRFGI